MFVQRVLRPRGGINEWLHWLPVSVHKKLDHFIRQIFGGSGLKVEGKKGMPLLGKKNGNDCSFITTHLENMLIASYELN